MRVWVDYGDHGGVSGVSAEPIEGRAAFELQGMEKKVLVARRWLLSAMERYTSAHDLHFCAWHDCGWQRPGRIPGHGEDRPHSGTCPLAEPEPAVPPPLPRAQVNDEVAAMAETVARLREDLERAEKKEAVAWRGHWAEYPEEGSVFVLLPQDATADDALAALKAVLDPDGRDDPGALSVERVGTAADLDLGGYCAWPGCRYYHPHAAAGEDSRRAPETPHSEHCPCSDPPTGAKEEP